MQINWVHWATGSIMRYNGIFWDILPDPPVWANMLLRENMEMWQFFPAEKWRFFMGNFPYGNPRWLGNFWTKWA
jgi:hypothetical protein